MKVIVAYIEEASSQTVRRLRAALGEDYDPGPLPYVSSPLESAEATRRCQMAMGVLPECPEDSYIAVQDAELRANVSEDAAWQSVLRAPTWNEFLDDWNTVEGEVARTSAERERYWVFFTAVKGCRMPPGLVFLVDKVSMNVFVRQYAYLTNLHPDGSPPWE